MQAKLSAVIITLNEEHNIGRCLESLRGVADEIVVVDSGSTDGTLAICEQHGARVVQQQWLGYAAQKNFANSMAANDWILGLDADEELSPALRESVISAKASSPLATASFNRLTQYCGKWIRHSGWYPDTKVRLFDRRRVQWAGTIHETPQGFAAEEVIHLQGDLHHYSYYTVEEHWAQLEKFSTLGAKALHDKGKRATWLDAVTHTVWKYFRTLVLRAAFLDGWRGWKIARLSSIEVWRKYRKLAAMGRKG